MIYVSKTSGTFLAYLVAWKVFHIEVDFSQPLFTFFIAITQKEATF